MTVGKLDLAALEAKDVFIHRHIGPSAADIAEMLELLGLDSLDALIDQAVPESIRAEFPGSLPGPRSEQDVLAELADLAARNKRATSMIGMGYYDTHTPPVILRNLLENPGWYTAYTPYQPEISQGRLEALLAFQTMVMDLTGMECANASLLDEATAAAEAASMSRAVVKKLGDRFFVSELCHPQTIAVMRTRADAAGIEIVVGDHSTALDDGVFFGALLQYPASGGAIHDYRAFIEAAHEKGMLVTVAADLLSLVRLVPPGEFGADIVVGSAQRFGVPMGFGGPHAAFFATHEKYRRAMPGRIVGASVVVDLTLSTLTQLLFTLVGVGLLLEHYGNNDIAKGAGAGVGLGLILVVGFCVFQHRGLARCQGPRLGECGWRGGGARRIDSRALSPALGADA